MKTFTDGKNQWSIDINVGSIKRVLAMTGHNLSLPHDPDANGVTLADRLIRETILQVDVIWALVQPQAKQLIALTAEEQEAENVEELRMIKFCESLKPELMAAAEKALIEEWKDFFLKLGRTPQAEAIATIQRLMLESAKVGGEEMARLANAQMGLMQAAMKSQVDEAIRLTALAIAGETSANATDSPESSASPTSTDARLEN